MFPLFNYSIINSITKLYFVFLAWAREKKINKQVHELSVEELDELLRQFYVEARNKKGEEYSKSLSLVLETALRGI